MNRQNFSGGWWIAIVLVAAGCSKSTERQMEEYMEFYYPSTGNYTYEIIFDWGTYIITTGAGTDEEVHPDSHPYRGYIAMRPQIKEGYAGKPLPAYLIAPDGAVWVFQEAGDIPEVKTREEVTVDRSSSGTTTSTTTINSPLEAAVDHFHGHQAHWVRYGTLERSGSTTVLRKPE